MTRNDPTIFCLLPNILNTKNHWKNLIWNFSFHSGDHQSLQIIRNYPFNKSHPRTWGEIYHKGWWWALIIFLLEIEDLDFGRRWTGKKPVVHPSRVWKLSLIKFETFFFGYICIYIIFTFWHLLLAPWKPWRSEG